MWKHYFIASSVTDALQRLAEYPGRARLVAGGTDLLIELERGVRKGIDTLIDVSRIPDQDHITRLDDQIVLGSQVTHNHVVENNLIQEHAFPFAQAAWEVGAPQIRNRGTVAGNLITASPANDTITPLWALDTQVTLSSLQGDRSLTFPEFYQGVRKTAMRPDEMLTAIHVPVMQPNERGMFIKLGLRRAQAIAVVNTAVILAFDGDVVTSAKITLGSVAPTIIRVPDAEQALIGNALTPDVIREAAEFAAQTPRPIDDVRSTAEYRVEMIRVLVARALRALAANEERRLWPAAPVLLWGKEPQTSLPAELPATDYENATLEFFLNGSVRNVASGQDKTLLRLLREDCGLPGTKEGCAEGECGACTVFLDGKAVMACLVPAPRAHGADIVTVEGLAQGETLHPVQTAFVEAGAVQCGYCTPGFLMSSAKLLEECPDPTPDQIQQSITGNLCRCTGYYKILEAVQNAAKGTHHG